MAFKKHFWFVMIVFFLAIAGGAAAYHNVEGWSFLDALYFVVITITTIGYGDLVPKTVQGKIFTMFFAFFGVATAFYILSLISSSIFKKHFLRKFSEIKKGVEKEKEVRKEVEGVIKRVVGKRKRKQI